MMTTNKPEEAKALARILSTGSYLPEQVLTNQQLEQMVETSDEWIFTRTGIRQRRIAAEGESTASMGAQAAGVALQRAGIRPDQIDFVIVCTMTPDYLSPSTAALIQQELKLTRAAAFDLQAACTGYLYGLSMAKALVESQQASYVLVVAAEKMSAFTDYQDRATCILFGDGAAASVVAAQGSGLAIRHTTLGADGEHAQLLWVPAGGARAPATEQTVQQRQHYLKMQGSELFKHAVRRMEGAIKDCLDHLELTEREIKWFIPHQANIRIIDAIAKRFDIPSERVYMTIHKYGNTSASSVAIALEEFLHQHPIQIEEHVLLVAFGAGLTWGAAILTQVD